MPQPACRPSSAGAIVVGIIAATALRIVFAGVATQLLQVIGLLLAGGVLLLWVCWKMWRELREQSAHANELAFSHGGSERRSASRKTFRQAAVQIVAADVSMSLDNVLAVAGAAREHPYILAFGLLLSVALMGVAADLLGRVSRSSAGSAMSASLSSFTSPSR